MIKLPKSVLSFGAVALVASALTLAVPRAAHAVAAALVQVTNTAANPAITQSVPSQAAQLVELTNNSGGQGTSTFTGLTPNFSGSAVPAGQSLVITSVDITPTCQGNLLFGAGLGIGAPGVLTTELVTWGVPSNNGSITSHFVYPSGIVIGPGSTPVLTNYSNLQSSCSSVTYLFGYLTTN